MFGLPCGDVPEFPEQMMDSVRAVVAAGSDGIKIVNLYILKGSAFEELYRQGKIRLLEYKEYLELVSRALQLLPAQMVVHRLAGDPDHKSLVAPAWCSDKKRILNDLNKLLQKQTK